MLRNDNSFKKNWSTHFTHGDLLRGVGPNGLVLEVDRGDSEGVDSFGLEAGVHRQLASRPTTWGLVGALIVALVSSTLLKKGFLCSRARVFKLI